LHTASRRIIELLIKEGIGTLVIGKNRYWKQEVDMGKHNNQTFVQIPHSRFIEMLQYKAQLVGITVIVREESYTSQASFLDGDEIPTYDTKRKEKPTFSGKREGRGLYRAKSGRRIQADVNGSYNILRKECPHAFSESPARPGQEILAAAVHPRQLVRKRREDTYSCSHRKPSATDDLFIRSAAVGVHLAMPYYGGESPHSRPGPSGRYRGRTCGLFRVKEALSH
jgi:putative transposase